MHWLKQIGLLFLAAITACHPSAQNEQVSIQKDAVVGPSICNGADSLHQVKAFIFENKDTYILPSFWTPEGIDTNTRIVHSQLPALFITMEEKDRALIYDDKNQSVPASMDLFLPDGTNVYEGEISLKTRGNTSWKDTEKKPFSIKLNKSTRLLGLEKGKSFTLVNNLLDESFIRNAIAFHLSRKLGIFAPDFTFITLYLNGNYLGVYQMSNKIEIGKRSVDIVDLEKENKQVNDRPLKEYPTFSTGQSRKNGHKKGVCISNPDDITGGYRLDYNGTTSMYELCVSGFVSQAGDPVRIKSPKYASREQVDYISDFYDQLETAVMSPTGYHPETGKHYTEYLDIESFARYFLLQEITQNTDGGWCSFMMYKDSGDSSKMFAGPAWDFDRGMKKTDDPKYPFHTLWTTSKTTLSDHPYSGGLLYWLWQHEDFQNLAKRIFFEELNVYLDDSIQWKTYADSLVDLLQHEVECDKMRFPANQEKSYQELANDVTGFLEERNDFLHWLWSTDPSEIVAIQLVGSLNPRNNKFEKELVLYGNKTDGVTIPDIPWEITFNHDPNLLGYFLCGTDSLVQGGTTFYNNQCVEIRWDYPNWFEIQYRRIKKKINKIISR